MKNLLLMRAPLKYIQGANALKHFYENIKEFGNNYLFICSNSAYKSTHDLIEESFKDSKTKRIYQIFGGISSVGEINKMREIVRNEKIDVVGDEYPWQIAEKFFGGKTQPAHECLPQSTLSVLDLLVDVYISKHFSPMSSNASGTFFVLPFTEFWVPSLSYDTLWKEFLKQCATLLRHPLPKSLPSTPCLSTTVYDVAEWVVPQQLPHRQRRRRRGFEWDS